MGWFDGVIGAAVMEPAAAAAEFGWLLAEDEQLQLAYRLPREVYLFTDRRFMLVRRRGPADRVFDCHTVPYRIVQHYRLRTAGMVRPYAMLTIWAADMPGPTALQFGRGVDMFDLQKLLGEHVGR